MAALWYLNLVKNFRVVMKPDCTAQEERKKKKYCFYHNLSDLNPVSNL